MPRVTFVHPFAIQLDSGVAYQFLIGDQYVPDDLMQHPKVLAYRVPDPPDDAPASEEQEESDEVQQVSKEEMLAKAQQMNIDVNPRWGVARLQAAIDAVNAAG